MRTREYALSLIVKFFYPYNKTVDLSTQRFSAILAYLLQLHSNPFASTSHALQWHKPTFCCDHRQLQYPPCPRSGEVNQGCGALLHFLPPPPPPPHSPDFSPIEETFSKVKQAMKSIEREITQIRDVKQFCYTVSCRYITPDDCHGWSHNCGIYNV